MVEQKPRGETSWEVTQHKDRLDPISIVRVRWCACDPRAADAAQGVGEQRLGELSSEALQWTGSKR